MKRLLCVTPAFPPSNAADCHRVRMALPYFQENGWEAEVLAVRPERVEAVQEPELLRTIPEGVRVHRVSALPQKLTRLVGISSLGLRAGSYLRREVTRLLQERKFDAVYFSSTVFSTFPMGIIWKKRFGVPFFIDYQDPWWSSYHVGRGQKPPGGWLKYGLVQWSARRQEGRVVREAAGVTCVSPAYGEMLRSRYPETDPARFLELPFGAPERDFEVAAGPPLHQAPTRSAEELRTVDQGKEIWRYIGRGGPDIETALRIFAGVLGDARPRPFRLELAGTSYASGAAAERTMAPVLEESLPAGTVTESPGRIGYLESLRKLQEAHRLVLFGSDDPQYTASKLYNYILARRPLLVICREESSVARIVKETKSAELITFSNAEMGDGRWKMGGEKVKPEWREAMGRWLEMGATKKPGTDWRAFEPYTAKEMTKKLCGFFEEGLLAEDKEERNG